MLWHLITGMEATQCVCVCVCVCWGGLWGQSHIFVTLLTSLMTPHLREYKSLSQKLMLHLCWKLHLLYMYHKCIKLGCKMWEQNLVLKVRRRRKKIEVAPRRPSWGSDLWCDLLPLCFCNPEVYPHKAKLHLKPKHIFVYGWGARHHKAASQPIRKLSRLSSSARSSCRLNTVQLFLPQHRCYG